MSFLTNLMFAVLIPVGLLTAGLPAFNHEFHASQLLRSAPQHQAVAALHLRSAGGPTSSIAQGL